MLKISTLALNFLKWDFPLEFCILGQTLFDKKKIFGQFLDSRKFREMVEKLPLARSLPERRHHADSLERTGCFQ